MVAVVAAARSSVYGYGKNILKHKLSMICLSIIRYIQCIFFMLFSVPVRLLKARVTCSVYNFSSFGRSLYERQFTFLCHNIHWISIFLQAVLSSFFFSLSLTRSFACSLAYWSTLFARTHLPWLHSSILNDRGQIDRRRCAKRANNKNDNNNHNNTKDGWRRRRYTIARLASIIWFNFQSQIKII